MRLSALVTGGLAALASVLATPNLPVQAGGLKWDLVVPPSRTDISAASNSTASRPESPEQGNSAPAPVAAVPVPAAAVSVSANAVPAPARVAVVPVVATPPPSRNPDAFATPLLAQASPAPDADAIRQQLLIPPLKIGSAYTAPSLVPGVPSAFIAGWGDYFIGVNGATQGKTRNQVDGSLNVGVGLGDLAKAVAVELDLNVASVRNFGANGTFDAKIGRLLVNQPRFRLAAAGGVVNMTEWGTDPKTDANGYGVLTAAWPLQPNNPGFRRTLQISAGGGGKTFGYNGQSGGAFGSIGVELLPNLGLSAGWSGRGANAALSWVPFQRTPLTISVTGADLFDQTINGPVAVFSLTWGSNFRTAQF